MKNAFCILTWLVVALSCTTKKQSGSALQDSEESFEAEPVGAVPQTPEDDRTGGGGIISGGVQPDTGRLICEWLPSDRKHESFYGCKTTSPMGDLDAMTLALISTQGTAVPVNDKLFNARGYDIVFIVPVQYQDQTLEVRK